jgi:hypothetical protein
MMCKSESEAKHYLKEVLRCRKSFAYFCDRYCQIMSDQGRGGDWVAFRLWPEQQRVAGLLQQHRLVVVLKARQLGLTWLTVAFSLWLLLFHPIATVLLFSRRDDEATDLLAVRLRGMHDHLPAWLQASGFTTANDHEWALVSGSRALAFPTTAGDSYTATLAIVDEADLCPDLDKLMRAVKPTIDAGGRMILLSRADKAKPMSAFKKIYRAARQGENEWTAVFLSWDARPDRTPAWLQAQRQDIFARTGAVDDLHEQYPATDAEALAPRSLDKRLPAEWLKRCYQPQEPLPGPFHHLQKPPAIHGLLVYALPVPGRRYVLGADPAEGNPTSDDSALVVLDVDSREEVACLAGRIEPATFAAYVDTVGRYYGRARIMVERNNHGHAVLLWLRDHSELTCLGGHDFKTGWLSNSKGKPLLYDRAGEFLRDGETIIHSVETFSQLASIEGSTLRAPEGQPDDRAMAFVLAIAGSVRVQVLNPSGVEEGPSVLSPGRGDLFGPGYSFEALPQDSFLPPRRRTGGCGDFNPEAGFFGV